MYPFKYLGRCLSRDETLQHDVKLTANNVLNKVDAMKNLCTGRKVSLGVRALYKKGLQPMSTVNFLGLEGMELQRAEHGGFNC